MLSQRRRKELQSEEAIHYYSHHDLLALATSIRAPGTAQHDLVAEIAHDPFLKSAPNVHTVRPKAT